jgi:tripartite-type tricarboxylate transporter receptor subunit TctC
MQRIIDTIAAAMVIATAPAAAQEWPMHPVTMVVPYAAGGTLDVFARVLAPRLSEILGQTVVVENVGGAGGMAGTARVARAAPDGYQFVFGNVGTHAHNQILFKTPLYNAATDFAPVALVAEAPIVLATRNDFPADNLPDFVAYARAHQKTLNFGSGGTGSPPHLACVLFNATIGVDVTHIPYRSGGQAMQDLIAGRSDYQCPGMAVARPQIEGKSVKAIAVLSHDRSPMLPALPSAREQGIDFDVRTWTGFFLPKGTPAAIVNKLHQATVATLQTPSVQERLNELGAAVPAPDRRSPEYLRKFVQSEIARWSVAIRAAGIAAQ